MVITIKKKPLWLQRLQVRSLHSSKAAWKAGSSKQISIGAVLHSPRCSSALRGFPDSLISVLLSFASTSVLTGQEKADICGGEEFYFSMTALNLPSVSAFPSM